VRDYCNDIHRRLAAVSTQRYRALDRQQHSIPDCCCPDFRACQLVRQPRHLRVHVETFPPLAVPGKMNYIISSYIISYIFCAKVIAKAKQNRFLDKGAGHSP